MRVFAMLLLMVGGFMVTGCERKPEAVKPSLGDHSGPVITKTTQPGIGCRDQAMLQLTYSFLEKGDRDAFHKAVERLNSVGDVWIFDKGEEVYVEGASPSKKYTQVRPKGEVDYWWVLQKTLE